MVTLMIRDVFTKIRLIHYQNYSLILRLKHTRTIIKLKIFAKVTYKVQKYNCEKEY